MRAILDIAINELRLIFKDKGIWINLVVLPIVIAFATGFANGAGSAPSGERPRDRVDVIDLDNSPQSAAFIATLREQAGTMRLCPLDDEPESDACRFGDDPTLDEARANRRIEANVTRALILIPAGFGESLNTGQNVNIIYRASSDAAGMPSYILQAAESAALQVGGVQVAVQTAAQVAETAANVSFEDDADRAAFLDGVREEASALWSQDLIGIEFTVASATTENEPRADTVAGFSQSVPGIGSMYVLLAVLPAAAAFIRERKQWTLQRLAVLPLSRGQILGGKLLARFLLGLIQYGIVFAFGAVLGVRYGSDPLALILIMISFTLCCTALMIMITGFLKSEQQAQGITLFVSLTLAPLGGAWWPLDIVPEWMRTIGHISPIAWAMDGYQELIFFGGGLGDVLVSIAVLLGMSVLFFAIGVARFKFD